MPILIRAFSSPLMLPSGCLPTEWWSAMLNVPRDTVRSGAVVTPFPWQTPIRFVLCPDARRGG